VRSAAAASRLHARGVLAKATHYYPSLAKSYGVVAASLLNGNGASFLAVEMKALFTCVKSAEGGGGLRHSARL